MVIVIADLWRGNQTFHLGDCLNEIQWNLSITDTLGTTKSVLIKEVSLFRRSLIERLHCSHTLTC